MPLKPSYLALLGVGGIVAYSGIKGKGVGSAIRQILGGQSPKTAAQTTAIITGTPQGGGQAATLDTSTVAGPTGPGETAFFTAVLLALAAPPTAADLTSFHNWRLHECPWDANPPDGAQYTHNPLNTTLHTGSSVGTVNSIGVQVYGTAAGGVAATAATLRSGYPAIVAALRAGKGLSTGDPAVAAELGKWSGGGYTSV